MLYALTPFEMMCGFRPVDVIWELLAGLEVPELTQFIEDLDRADPAEALQSALTALLTGEIRHQQVPHPGDRSPSAGERSTQRPSTASCRIWRSTSRTTSVIVASLFLNHRVGSPRRLGIRRRRPDPLAHQRGSASS